MIFNGRLDTYRLRRSASIALAGIIEQYRSGRSTTLLK